MGVISIFVVVVFVVLSIIFFVIPQLESDDIIEGIRGGRGGRRGRRGRYEGRRWYGGNIGYGYRPPVMNYGRRYIPWLTSGYWFTGECKDGCTNIGNNNWGCQYPGYGYNDCMFGRDCMGCGV